MVGTNDQCYPNLSFQFPSLTQLHLCLSPVQSIHLLEYLNHLMLLDLNCTVSTFNHFQTQIVQVPGVHLNESHSVEWCKQMDTHLVSNVHYNVLTDANCF